MLPRDGTRAIPRKNVYGSVFAIVSRRDVEITRTHATNRLDHFGRRMCSDRFERCIEEQMELAADILRERIVQRAHALRHRNDAERL